MSQFHVNQIETYLRNTYGASHWNPSVDDTANLSRLLALHAVNLGMGPQDGDGDRTVEITEGAMDRGIDAIGVDESASRVVVVQSKWRKDGTGSLRLPEVLRFLGGVRALLGMRSTDPVHASPETRRAAQEALRTPGGSIHLATVSTAIDPLSTDVTDSIEELLGQVNDLEGTEPIATHVHFAQGDLFRALSAQPRANVDLELQLQDWGRASDPLKIYYGRVSAAEIAGWYRTHGSELFSANIRVVIPRSDINDGILATIKNEPDRFGYYNNGITVLAQEIEASPAGALHRDVGYFRLKGASIVNGAQTVSMLGKVLETDYRNNLGSAFVMVRCIEVSANDVDISRSITRFANTQNEISSQDFAFLDQQQHRLARELRVLGLEYVIRSSEKPHSSDPFGHVDVRTAAVALACSSETLSHAVIAKREVSRLFSDPSVYRALFNPSTDAVRLYNTVHILWAVDKILDDVAQVETGIEAGVAVHARLVVCHVVMRKLGSLVLSDPSRKVAEMTKNLDADVRSYLSLLVHAFPQNAYPGNVFKNLGRVTELLKGAGLSS